MAKTREEIAAKWLFRMKGLRYSPAKLKRIYRILPQWYKDDVAHMLRELDAARRPKATAKKGKGRGPDG